eukprot:SAG31_NODE_202_length_20512_cov_62.659237_4_plen_182_part_00
MKAASKRTTARLGQAQQVRGVTFSFLCPLLEKYGTFIARCNALIEKVSPCVAAASDSRAAAVKTEPSDSEAAAMDVDQSAADSSRTAEGDVKDDGNTATDQSTEQSAEPNDGNGDGTPRKPPREFLYEQLLHAMGRSSGSIRLEDLVSVAASVPKPPDQDEQQDDAEDATAEGKIYAIAHK